MRVGRTTYRRVFSVPALRKSKPIVAYALPDRQTMPAKLAGRVDSWTQDGSPVFTSRASAKRFETESQRLHAAGETGEEWHFDRGPTGAEVRQAREAGVKKYRAEMLKRPRPKGL